MTSQPQLKHAPFYSYSDHGKSAMKSPSDCIPTTSSVPSSEYPTYFIVPDWIYRYIWLHFRHLQTPHLSQSEVICPRLHTIHAKTPAQYAQYTVLNFSIFKMLIIQGITSIFQASQRDNQYSIRSTVRYWSTCNDHQQIRFTHLYLRFFGIKFSYKFADFEKM